MQDFYMKQPKVWEVKNTKNTNQKYENMCETKLEMCDRDQSKMSRWQIDTLCVKVGGRDSGKMDSGLPPQFFILFKLIVLDHPIHPNFFGFVQLGYLSW